jgi:nitrogen fixation protein NifZ
VKKGDIGYVTSIGTFLQQFYIYAVDFIDTGHRVGMRGKELEAVVDETKPAVEPIGAEATGETA